jgi:hypothetical protein
LKLWLVPLKVIAYLLIFVNLTAEQEYASSERQFKITFYCSCAKCCGRHSPQRGGKGLTAMGNAPIQFRTGATGDPSLLGKWVYFEDLGDWVHLTDTGVKCAATKASKTAPAQTSMRFTLGKRRRATGCVSADQIDIFVGGPEWHKHALRMGVMNWKGRVR